MLHIQYVVKQSLLYGKVHVSFFRISFRSLYFLWPTNFGEIPMDFTLSTLGQSFLGGLDDQKPGIDDLIAPF